MATPLDLRYGIIRAVEHALPFARATPDSGSAIGRAYGTRIVRKWEIDWPNATFHDYQRIRRHYDANATAFLASLPGIEDPVLVKHSRGPTGNPSGPTRLTVTVFLVEALATSEAT